MNETEFHQLVDSQMQIIEEAIDESGADIDFETSGNVMTLEFDDGSQIIINRQEPMKEIWLASKLINFNLPQYYQIIHPEEGGSYVVPYRNDSAVYSKPSKAVNA